MTNYVIVGAGAAGLYTAYRLLAGGTLNQGDTVRLFEWSNRPGGRIYSYTFPPPVGSNGLYCEFGGMRFATDQNNFPNNPSQITEGHVLVQQTIIALGLKGKVVPFGESSNRLYYLRGSHVYENNLSTLQELQGLPYNFNSQFKAFAAGIPNAPPPPVYYTADTILGQIANQFAPKLTTHNSDRPNWCKYYSTGQVPPGNATPSFPAGTLVYEMGYWNLLYDQFGDEGFDYSADGTGYTSNVINWNAADAMQANNDYGSGSSYMRLDGGYSLLFEALAAKITELAANYPGSGIVYGQQLVNLLEQGDNTTLCTFFNSGWPDQFIGNWSLSADVVFLAMPRRSLELVAQGCLPNSILNNPLVQAYLESSIDQPAIKAVLVFDQPWWTSAPYPPNLVSPDPNKPLPAKQQVGGATITDLPLRMVYYFANNIPNGPGASGGPYVMLASYDDMNYSDFWRVVEQSGDYTVAPSQKLQPLTGPTSVPVDSAFANLLLKQLAEVHGTTFENIPTPMAVYFQDWGQDPFGGGYHGWSSHYNICQAMDYIRAPYQKIMQNPQGHQIYIIGSCYSFDQAWVEGALCTAESVLQDFLGLPPLSPNIKDYRLICRSTDS
ncbi:MAG TPA: FAD-dependent oxidoreductase [Xanthobacteraceae bacterium]|jgi:hypothetical protein|nr:FAD-dependent oxidoreductase [Xanthobacteraceae bacterium]